MKKSKKIVIYVAIGIALIALFVLFIRMSIKGDSSIIIDREHFPDDVLRQKISNEFDKNKDGMLSAEEIRQADEFIFDHKEDKKKLLKLDGLQYFKNLKKVQIKAYMLDIGQGFQGAAELRELRLDCHIAGQKIDLSHNLKLRKLNIEEPIETIHFSELKDLEDVSVRISGTNDILIDHLENITKINLNARGPSRVKIGECPRLKEVYVEADQYGFPVSLELQNCREVQVIEARGTSLQNIELNGMDCLKNLSLQTSTVMKELRLTELPKLHALELDQIEKLQKLEIKDTPELSSIKINDSYDLEKFDLDKQKNLQYISLEDVRSLRKLDLTDMEKLWKICLNNCDVAVLDLGRKQYLEELSLNRLDDISYLDLSMCPNLRKIEIDDVPNLLFQLQNLNKMTELYVAGNTKIKEIDLRMMKDLHELTWENGRLKKIHWGKKNKLNYISVFNNDLTGEIDIDRFPVLEKLCCDDNRIESITSQKESTLTKLECQNNNLKNVRLSTANLSFLDCTKNPEAKIYLDKKPEDLGDECGPHYFFDKTASVFYATD